MTPAALFSRPVKTLHAVGVGGMGLGPLAIYLTQSGYTVSGEDDAMSDAMESHLKAAGVTLRTGVPGHCDLLVYSSAIPENHPTRTAARARAIPEVRRGELLAELAREKKLAAICGSHGKTTTTAMLITALRSTNFPFGYILGGLFSSDLTPAAADAGEWLVAEVDESDGTIDRFSPELTIAVNLDWDHPDYYETLGDLETTFAGLFGRTGAAVILNASCELSRRVAAQVTGRPIHWVGAKAEYAYSTTEDATDRMRLTLRGAYPLEEAVVNAVGDFNAANAAMALAAAHQMGAKVTADALAGYVAVRRRQTVLPSPRGLRVIEDYAHHPAEIKALLRSLRKRVGERVQVVFQPHRFSRTAQFLKDFCSALALADRVYLLDVYAAGEDAQVGGTTADLFAEFGRSAPLKQVVYHPGRPQRLMAELAANVRPGDVVAFVGAGDIDGFAREWLSSLAPRKASPVWTELADALRKKCTEATKVRWEEPLKEKTTFRIGGAARCYVEPASEEDLKAALTEASARGLPVLMLGRGSNLLIPDEGVDALVIALAHRHWQRFEKRADDRVKVGAGLRLKNLCGLAAKEGLAGFEFLEGIPGNVGGALRMNAGAMGGWIFDIVEEIEVMALAGVRRVLPRGELHVGYRKCEELDGAIALSAVLRPTALGDAQAVARQIDVYRDKRQKSQPREPSAGCVFKNPDGDSAGRIIDALGLKGLREGDAEVSPVHANFIVNRGAASAADVIALMRKVRAEVAAKGINLEPEILLYGKEWKEVL